VSDAAASILPWMQADHDVIVLGAGNTGLAAASGARKGGKSVLVVEKRDVGGTCPLRGCVPKKVLVAAADALDVIDRAHAHHIEVAPPRLDWARLIERERTFVAGVSASLEKDLKEEGTDLVRGAARFVGPHDVEVDGVRFRAKTIVVGVGAKPRPLDLEGGALAVTSDDLLFDPVLPRSLVFVGAGVIALELTHVLARAGVKVTLLEALPRALGKLDADLVDALLDVTRKLGVEIRLGVKVLSIAKDGGGGGGFDGAMRVRYEEGGAVRELRADRVANGSGRVADLDASLRSRTNPDVYFGGDANPRAPQLSPVATYDGRVIGRNIAHGTRDEPDYRPIPSAVYTVPPLASVGLTEAEAREAKRDVVVKDVDMSTWKSARTYAERAARAKIVIEKGSDLVLGAQLLRRNADEVIHAFAFAMKLGITSAQLKDMVCAFPTFHADIRYLLE
jgi:glutathione reductase (NADPH)